LGGNVIESVVRVGSGSRRYALVLRRRLRDVARTTATVRRALAVSGGLGLLAALAAGFLLAGRLARRITTLRDAMAQAPGDAEVPVDTGHDEIGDLSRSFAELRRRVAEQEEARRRFVATASHELRTPLASLHLILAGVAEELDARDPDLPDVREQIARAGTQSERLVRLAAELLDLSHLDAAVPLRRELVELTEVARSVVAEFRGRPDGAAAELSADTPCWALADPGAVARCVRILVDNALRYGGAARVSVGGPDGVARVAVADDGPGVPPDEAEAVFERFARGSAGATAPGSGLGLAIGRELARAMSGDLRLAEPNGARGATFELVLPPGSGH
jgi:signal transduction histidine kinase